VYKFCLVSCCSVCSLDAYHVGTASSVLLQSMRVYVHIRISNNACQQAYINTNNEPHCKHLHCDNSVNMASTARVPLLCTYCVLVKAARSRQ
jgi:hypothetical protein